MLCDDGLEPNSPTYGIAADPSQSVRVVAGPGTANPVASFWTGALMLEHLGETAAADLLMRAVEQVCAAGIVTPALGGKVTIADVTPVVSEAVWCGA